MNNDLERCESCQGRKKMLMLGGIEKQCPFCMGIGWIAKKIDLPKAAEPQLESVLEPPKKRGRKKRVA